MSNFSAPAFVSSLAEMLGEHVTIGRVCAAAGGICATWYAIEKCGWRACAATVVVSGTCTAALLAKEYGWRERVDFELRRVIVDRLGSSPNDEFRRAFQDRLLTDRYRSPEGHSHGLAAGERTSAQNSIVDFVRSEGYEPYIVSMSSRDKGRDGFHGYYLTKDVLHLSQSTNLGAEHVIVVVDADYYMDMRQWIRPGRPIIMYTFAPQRVAGKMPNAVYTIENDHVTYRVGGGGLYRHPVWDYSRDQLRVDYLTGSWFCSVETKQWGQQRQVVLINPTRWVATPLARLVGGSGLERRRFSAGDQVNRSDYLTESGEVRVSLGHAGAFVCADLTLAAYEAIRIRVKHSKEANVHTVEKYMVNSAETEEEKAEAVYSAPIVFEVISADQTRKSVPFVPGGKPANFQCVGKRKAGFLVSEEGKALGRMVAPPLTTNDAVVPRESLNNDIVTVEGRVNKVRNLKVPHHRFVGFAQEFVEMLVPSRLAGKGVPWDAGEVMEVQCRPTQRARSEKVRHFMTTRDSEEPIMVNSFMKREAYNGVTDPRNISTTPTSHTLRLSAFTYAMKADLLKTQAWYSPTKSPAEIAERLTDMASVNSVLSETDYSRYDGTISEWLRKNIERKVYLRWCAATYRPELGRLLNAELNPPAFTKAGVKYQPGCGRLSGSPLTTDANTIINAFCSFAASRLAGQSTTAAWEHLGAYAGDDGVTGVDKTWMHMVADELGLKLKCKEVRRGQALSYLGRVFPDVWTTPGSVQDPVRSAKKLHISFAPPEVGQDEALFNRASGYLTLDPRAPIVGDWCRKVMDLLGPQVKARAEAVVEKCAVDAPYYGTWPQIEDGELAIATVADAYGVDGSTILRWSTAIKEAMDLSELGCIVDAPDADKTIAARHDSVTALTDASSVSSGSPPRRVKPARRRRRRPTDSGRGSSA